MSSDGVKSFIRTLVPLAVGYLATLLVTFIAAKFGIEVDGETAYSLTYGAVTAAVYALGRWLETRPWAPARAFGRLILSLGLVADKPTYPPTVPPGTVRPLKRHEL